VCETQVPTAVNTTAPKINSGAMSKTKHLNYRI
jgi:hypothetical protein